MQRVARVCQRQLVLVSLHLKVFSEKLLLQRRISLAVRKLEYPSLGVAPTTLWLMLLICSFEFRSVFLPRCKNWFSLSAEKRPRKQHFPHVTLNSNPLPSSVNLT